MSDDNTTPVDDAARDAAEGATAATAERDEVAGEASGASESEYQEPAAAHTDPVAEDVEPEAAADHEPAASTAAGQDEAADEAQPAAEPEVEAAAEGDAAEPPADEPPAAEVPAVPTKQWYVVKIQSGREDTIKAAIERKVKIEGLEEFFGQIAVPVEEVVEKKKVKVRVKDKKTGEVESVYQEKNVVKKRKKFPGYLFAQVEFNDRILYLFRETSGVGDFVGAAGPMKPPAPMSDREVQAMLTGISGPDPSKKKVKVKLDFEKGDKVRIREGAFSGMEGEVKAITEPKDATETPKVTVEVTIFGRPVPVELDYWQVDKA